LTANFPASILVTIHPPSHFWSSLDKSWLDEIIAPAGPLSATFATDQQVLKKAHIYIAPPGMHLIVDGERDRAGSRPA
jgi:chemotaxis response regulator CheB